MGSVCGGGEFEDSFLFLFFFSIEAYRRMMVGVYILTRDMREDAFNPGGIEYGTNYDIGIEE